MYNRNHSFRYHYRLAGYDLVPSVQKTLLPVRNNGAAAQYLRGRLCLYAAFRSLCVSRLYLRLFAAFAYLGCICGLLPQSLHIWAITAAFRSMAYEYKTQKAAAQNLRGRLNLCFNIYNRRNQIFVSCGICGGQLRKMPAHSVFLPPYFKL